MPVVEVLKTFDSGNSAAFFILSSLTSFSLVIVGCYLALRAIDVLSFHRSRTDIVQSVLLRACNTRLLHEQNLTPR